VRVPSGAGENVVLAMKPGLGLPTAGLPEFTPGAPAVEIAVQQAVVRVAREELRRIGRVVDRVTRRRHDSTNDRR
jgi:hypothetical protein